MFAWMHALSGEERRRLLRFFSRLEAAGVKYVILRKYERLPRHAPDDIDLFVAPADLDRAVELAESVGFEPPDGSASPLETALRNPVVAARFALRNPAAALQAVVGDKTGSADPDAHHRQYGTVTLDIVDRLRFPERGSEPVPAAVETLLLERRRRYGQWYVPSPPDELAHIIAHCLADYTRTFPEYYATRYDRLRETVLSDSRYRSEFRELLELLFGDEATAVFGTVETGECEAITEPLSLDGDEAGPDNRSAAR